MIIGFDVMAGRQKYSACCTDEEHMAHDPLHLGPRSSEKTKKFLWAYDITLYAALKLHVPT